MLRTIESAFRRACRFRPAPSWLRTPAIPDRPSSRDRRDDVADAWELERASPLFGPCRLEAGCHDSITIVGILPRLPSLAHDSSLWEGSVEEARQV